MSSRADEEHDKRRNLAMADAREAQNAEGSSLRYQKYTAMGAPAPIDQLSRRLDRFAFWTHGGNSCEPET